MTGFDLILRNRFVIFHRLILLTSFIAVHAYGLDPVQIIETDSGRFQLHVEGKPYFVKGVGGTKNPILKRWAVTLGLGEPKN